jgi:hypothetical protein
MAPPGFGRAKANVAAKQQQEQNNGTMPNSTNIPLLQANSTGRWVGGGGERYYFYLGNRRN